MTNNDVDNNISSFPDEEMDIELVEKQIEIEEIEDEQVENLKLDYTIESPAERNKLVEKIIANTPYKKLTPKYVEILTDYIIFAMDKEERKKKKILTDNRMVTVNKRETSFEGLVGKFENGEDGIYNMITNDKNIIFAPKVSITQQDIDEVPGLKELRDAIEIVEKKAAVARGKRKYLLKKQIIEMRQDQYVLKNSYRQPMYCMNMIKGFNKIDFDDKITIELDEEGNPFIKDNSLISFFNPKHISALLCHYSQLKEAAWGNFKSDSYYLMEDLDDLVEKTLKEDYPLYYDLMIYKIDGKQNIEIQELLYEKHGIKHSVEYISSLWRNKIPKLLADRAEKDYLTWYYTIIEKGKWKKCSKCGQIKLAHNKFFSKNKTAKDGWYSQCKDCRNSKTKKNK